MQRWPALVCVLAVTACAGDVAESAVPQRIPPAAADAVTAAAEPPGEQDLAALLAMSRQYSDSVDTVLRRVRYLSRRERELLLRDRNDVQVERARQLGTRVTSSVEPLVRAGALVRIPDTTKYWIIRELDHSDPYATPDAFGMLIEIGRRFHSRLDSIGAPRYRLDVTSLLRTPELQAQLRRRNPNAARDESAHEFGTTVDISYRRFAAPADALPLAPHPSIAREARLLHDSLVVETGRVRGHELRAVLGRVLYDMQQEDRLLVRMERRQPVYHITVARRMQRSDILAGR